MKNVLLLLLLTVNCFGQKIYLDHTDYKQYDNGNLVDYFDVSESVKVSDTVEIKFQVGQTYKETFVSSAYVFVNGKNINVAHVFFITAKDTVGFMSEGTKEKYGEELLLPTSKLGKLKKDLLTQIVFIPKDKSDVFTYNKDAIKNRNYFSRFLPLVPYNN